MQRLAAALVFSTMFYPSSAVGAARSICSGSLILALAASSDPASLTAVQPLLRRDEPYAAQWVVTDSAKACEANSEDIHRHSFHTSKTLTDCMRACEGFWGCLAVDYYAKSNVCNLFRNACTTPSATHDGASSYRIKRPVTWDTLSTTAACKGSVKHFFEKGYVHSMEHCEQLCENRAGCIAVDYYRTTTVCQLYQEVCSHPSFVQDGSMSLVMRRELTWIITSETMGCESNLDKVHFRSKRHFPEGGLSDCRQWCGNIDDCRGVDWYKDTKWCIWYDDACTHPAATADGVESWRVVREGLPKPAKKVGLMRRELPSPPEVDVPVPSIWSTIDDKHACQVSAESVKHFKQIKGTANFGLTGCQEACENHHKCTAIDWYRKTDYCFLYEQACSTPQAGHDGASSMKIVRTDLAAHVSSPGSSSSAGRFGTVVAFATSGLSGEVQEFHSDTGSLAMDAPKAVVPKQTHEDWLTQLSEALKAFDTEGSGFITQKHARQAVAHAASKHRHENRTDGPKAIVVPPKLTEGHMNTVLGEANSNGDGKVDYQDFLGLLKQGLSLMS